MTVAEGIRDIAYRLEKVYGEGESMAMARWIVEHIMDDQRATSKPYKLFADEYMDTAEKFISELETYRPLQYVLQEAWFCGLKFFVDERVLIPRPETEELVEWVISDALFPLESLNILDAGTGSGCIAIALKKRLGKSIVSGCDISEEALAVAKRNAAALNADVNFFRLDLLAPDKAAFQNPIDILISNPPYIPHADKVNMDRNVTQFEPSIALFTPDNDPLLFYRALAKFGNEYLAANGNIYCEIYELLGRETEACFREYGYTTVLKNDMQGKPRMIRATLETL